MENQPNLLDACLGSWPTTDLQYTDTLEDQTHGNTITVNHTESSICNRYPGIYAEKVHWLVLTVYWLVLTFLDSCF
jgi:hypothetical protein